MKHPASFGHDIPGPDAGEMDIGPGDLFGQVKIKDHPAECECPGQLVRIDEYGLVGITVPGDGVDQFKCGCPVKNTLQVNVDRAFAACFELKIGLHNVSLRQWLF
jgi:hypothetical protein